MLPAQPIYTIRIGGHLSPRWSEWFDGLEITHLDNGETRLTGPVADQSALFGLLLKLRDLGLVLLSVECRAADSSRTRLTAALQPD